jgi:hypothetical protein
MGRLLAMVCAADHSLEFFEGFDFLGRIVDFGSFVVSLLVGGVSRAGGFVSLPAVVSGGAAPGVVACGASAFAATRKLESRAGETRRGSWNVPLRRPPCILSNQRSGIAREIHV